MDRAPIIEKIGLIFARKEEEAGFERVMSESRNYMQVYDWMTRRRLGSVELIVTVSGSGAERASKTAQRLIDYGVTSLVCAGLAAGLDPNAQVGDVFIADTIISHPDSALPPLYSSPALLSLVPPDAQNYFSTRRCTLVTSEQPLTRTSSKADIYHATGAAVLDRESYAVARTCFTNDVPFLAVRGTSERADQTLPRHILKLLYLPDTLGRALFAVAKPSIWPALARFHRQSQYAAATLGDTLAMMLLRII